MRKHLIDVGLAVAVVAFSATTWANRPKAKPLTPAQRNQREWDPYMRSQRAAELGRGSLKLQRLLDPRPLYRLVDRAGAFVTIVLSDQPGLMDRRPGQRVRKETRNQARQRVIGFSCMRPFDYHRDVGGLTSMWEHALVDHDGVVTMSLNDPASRGWGPTVHLQPRLLERLDRQLDELFPRRPRRLVTGAGRTLPPLQLPKQLSVD